MYLRAALGSTDEHVHFVGSLAVKDDKTSTKKDEIPGLLSTTVLGIQSVDPYEDFHETQSDLSSCYSKNKNLQSR